MKKLRVTVDGKSYEVLVEILGETPSSVAPASPAPKSSPAPLQLHPVEAPRAASTPVKAGTNEIPSPLAGKVVSIDVKVGDAVQEGAQVATIEAMKMNTYIYAPKSGTVAALLVSPGDGVDEGSPLLRIT